VFCRFGVYLLRRIKRKWISSRAISDTGLAGLRVGYGAFPLSIIEYLWRAKQPYNVSVAAEVSACAALQNPTYLEVHLPQR
jgi:histidinol-phosphate/aromatic aminotransferase/cobyric acid decarboxylase-like protein